MSAAVRYLMILVAALIASGVSLAQEPSGTANQSAPASVRANRVTDVQATPTEKKVQEKTAARGTAARLKLDPQVYGQAAAVFRAQTTAARQRGDRKAEAEAAINSARASEMLSVTDKSEYAHAEASYRTALSAAKEVSDVSAQSLAANNLAVLLLKQGKSPDALAAMQDVQLASLPANQRPAYQYNVARTLELNGDRARAYQNYVEAYRANPDLTRAGEGAFRLLMEAPAPRVTDAMQLADIAIANASPAMAHPRLQRLLMKWGNDRDAQRLLAELVRCYTAERLSSDKFRQSELSYLREIASTYPRLRVPVDQVGAAYVGNLPPRPREAGRAFTEWRYDGWQQDAMASLLTMVGDLYASNDNYGFALTRYGAAWDIAHEPKYALEFASLVQKKPELDPQGSLINDLLDSMFMEKGGYYMKKDWPNILRMHVAIGTIFEDRRQWGSAGEPRSAIFQWEHALIADQEVRRTQLGMPPSPGVNLHLANCYAAVGRTSAATQQYLTAAEGYLKAGDPIEASTAAGFARKVGGAQLSPEDMRRLKGAEETIDRMMTSRKR